MKSDSGRAFPATIETERLVLREWREDDADALFHYASDERVGPAAGWPPHDSVASSEEVIRNVLARPGVYAVTVRGSDEPIGSVGLQIDKDISDELELGYWIAMPFWGRGYAGEACEALLRHAFETLGEYSVRCGAFEENSQSRRVQEKLGFAHSHTVPGKLFPLIDARKDLVVTRLTRDDWQRRQPEFAWSG